MPLQAAAGPQGAVLHGGAVVDSSIIVGMVSVVSVGQLLWPFGPLALWRTKGIIRPIPQCFVSSPAPLVGMSLTESTQADRVDHEPVESTTGLVNDTKT